MGLMICWALQDDATGSMPDSDVWARIRERAEKEMASSATTTWWQRLHQNAGDLAHWILESPLQVPAEYAAAYPPLPRYLWETAAMCLPLPQGDLPMRPGLAGSGVVPLLN